MNDEHDVNDAKYLKYRSKFFISEFSGTALLLLGSLSLVISMFGSGSPMAGALLASLACSLLAKRITIAKLCPFDSKSEGDTLLRRSEKLFKG